VLTPGHNLWPSKLVTNLYRDAVGQTDHIKLAMHTNTPVTAITHLTDPSFDPSTSSLSDVSSDPPRRHLIHTPRGDIKCASVVHATNAYASYLLPHMQGPNGIIPTRGQVVALRAAVTSAELTKRSWYGNEGFEYWFPRPLQTSYINPEKEDVEVTGDGLQTPLVQDLEEHPVVILGGGREAEGPGYEYYNADDSTVGEKAGKVLRDFLPGLFPGKYEHGREPEMEWTGVMGFTKTGDPFVGPVAPFTKENEGQFIAAGYHGHGMPRTFACAEAIADIVMKELNGGKFEHWLAPEWLPERYLTRSKR
jgi:glycine/D-amino acid oxidase-like deaminating enzyme